MKKVLVILLCMCILISGVSVAQTNVEAEQHVVVKAMCDKKEYKLNMVKFNEEWYINAVDLAELADVKYGYNGKTGKVWYMRKDVTTILYNGDCIYVDGTDYVPAVQATVACGIRFCEYKGELRAERLRTPEDLCTQLTDRVFANENINISRAIVENPMLMGSAMVASESYQILSKGLLSGIIKYISGDVYRERYENAMNSLLDFDDDIGSLMETIEDGDELLVKLNKYISNGEGAAEAGAKAFYKLFKGMTEEEAEWQLFLDGLDEYGDFASIRYMLEDYAVVSKVIDSIGGLELISDITSLYDAQASVLYTMEDIFAESETEYAEDVAEIIMARYEKEGIAIANGIDTIAKSLVYSALDEVYEKGFDMEIKFSENPKLFFAQIGEKVVFDWILNIDDKAQFLTMMPVYSDLQLDIESYFYKNYRDIGGAKMRGAGIMYLNAALHYFELLEFDKNIDLSSTIDYMNKELADILSYEEDEYLPNYDNADLIVIAEMGGNVTDEEQDLSEENANPSGNTTYYATHGGTYYHAIADCNGMIGASVFTEEEVIAVGKKACPECIGDNDLGSAASKGASIIQSGSCGENVSYQLDEDGVLTISGNGDMWNYKRVQMPWYDQKSCIITVIIEEGVNSVGDFGIYNCPNLTDITLPDSVKTIGKNAFQACTNLTCITFPNNVTTIGSNALAGCANLTNVTIPNGVTAIGQGVFRGCSSLINFTIPNGVTTIEDAAFSYCTSLSSITIPDSVTSIGQNAFQLCSALTNVIIPNGVTAIGDYSFKGCSGLTSITIPDKVSTIGGHAFENCSALTSVIIPNGVTTIGGYAFAGCSSLTSITIPDRVTTIGYNTFENCSALTNVIVPNGVTTIESYAFAGCSNLNDIEIPDNITSFGDYAFAGCSSLTSITIPNSVTFMGFHAFDGCFDNLTFYGTAGSYAEKYANEHGFTFVER